MNTKIKQNIKAIILGLVLTLGLSYAVADFTAPNGFSAPTCPPNVEACNPPINTGATAQIKSGTLQTGGLGIIGNFSFLPSISAVTTPGQVLTATNNAGAVAWAGPVPKYVPVASYNNQWVNIPPGTTQLIVTATGETYCKLWDDHGVGAELSFTYVKDTVQHASNAAPPTSGTPTEYAKLRADSGSNLISDSTYGYARISASVTGYIDTLVGSPASVYLSFKKNTYRETNATPYSTNGLCPDGDTQGATVQKYVIYAI